MAVKDTTTRVPTNTLIAPLAIMSDMLSSSASGSKADNPRTSVSLTNSAIKTWSSLNTLRHTLASPADVSSTTDKANGKRIVVDGHSLDVAQLVATARFRVSPVLDGNDAVRDRSAAAVQCLNNKLNRGESLYGINT